MKRVAPPHSADQVGRITRYILLSGLPAVGALVFVIWSSDYSSRFKFTATLPLLLVWVVYAAAARQLLIRHLQSLTNVLSALREGDYSLRLRPKGQDALADLNREINFLGDTLQRQRRSETEATHLLTSVIEEIEAAVFAFDEAERLRLINPHGRYLLGRPEAPELGTPAKTLGLSECLTGPAVRVLPSQFLHQAGRWGMRRSVFYAEGKPHQLLLISDLSQALRDEEQVAWQRLVRVLTHELNNSLTPIKSIAGSLQTSLQRSPRDADWEHDLSRGLEIIAGRADGLSRFTDGYSRLARLPDPVLQPIRLPEFLHRIQQMDTRVSITLRLPPLLPQVQADAMMLEQALINLVKNAAEAALQEPATEAGRVDISARTIPGALEIAIADNGPGVANPANLFVPFFTTKPEGSGIGLVLARQIIEKHHGTLVLRNEKPRGCTALVTLPA